MENPVYVDDSPLAWEMFQRAQDQARDNVAESVRLYQELLDQYGKKLIPVAPAELDRLYGVRSRVLDAVRGHDEVLTRYQLIEQAEAERLLAGDELELLVETRSLTAPGLEALLRLGQRELEAARFRAALRLLSEASQHPSLSTQQAAHCDYMIGLASHYVGEPARMTAARDRLLALGRAGEPFLAELDRLTAQPTSNGPAEGVSPVDRDVEFAIDELVPQEIWSQSLSETMMRQRYSDGGRGTGFADRRRRGSDVVTIAATATDNAVYVNEGHAVHAFDRFTGYELWPAPFRDRLLAAIQQTPDFEVGDLNLIAVEGDALVTLTGHAGGDARSNGGLLACIDARTGDGRWSVDFDRLLGEEEYDGLFPYGAPLIAEGRVFCLARKQSSQTLTATYLVALDLTKGEPVWVRHIASSALIRMHNTRPFSLPVYDDGEIIVATSVGAVACIDASSGHFKWLRVHRPPITEPALFRQPWEISGPAVTPRGIVTIQPDESRVMLVDRTTGQMLESYPTGMPEDWGSPRYLVADDRYVVAVGTSVHAFDVDDLLHPVWQMPAPEQSSVMDGPEPTNPRDESALADQLNLAGRVQLTESALVVPTTDGLRIVDVETGREVQRIPLRSNVVPLALDSQLFVAGADYLDAYMPFGTAERILRERLERSPGEIEPALSLLRLGIRVRQLDLALEAAETARKILAERTPSDTVEAGRETLFAMLLEAARLGLGESVEDGERLHATLRAVAITPEQQVEQLLAYGAWAAERGAAGGRGEPQRLREAVEAYQTILDHELLASTERESNGVSKSARRWAIDRLDAMIAKHGRSVYAPQEDYARLELEQLTSRGANVTELRALAARFPFADAAGDAALRGAQLLVDAGLQRDALAMLATVQNRVPAGRQPASPRLLGEMVRLSEAMGWRDHAASVLRNAILALPDTPLVIGEGSRDPKTWLELLGAAREAPPAIGDQQGPAERLAGVLVSGQQGWNESGSKKLLFIVNGDTLRALIAPDLTEAWTSKIGAATWELLGVRDGAAILWQRSPIQDPRAVAIDLDDGHERWRTPSLDSVERNAVEQIRRERGGIELMPDGTPLNPAEVLPVLTDDHLLLVRRTGEVYSIDLRHGEPVMTLARQTLQEVHQVLATDLGVVLVGRSVPMGGRGASGAKSPAIVLVSHDTGEVLLRVEPTGAGVLWSALTGLDELAFGTDAGVELVSLHTGSRIWRQMSSPALVTRKGWVTADRVLVEDSQGALRSIVLQTGALSEPFNRPRSVLGGDSSALVDVVVSEDRIYAQFSDRIVRVSNDGGVLGADVITGERDYKWLLPTADRLVLVSKTGTQQVRQLDEATSKTQHYYRIYSLSENGAVVQDGSDLEPLDDAVREAMLVDGWLILSTGPATLAVPMPVAE